MTGFEARYREIHEHSRESARRFAPDGKSVFAGMALYEFAGLARWTADGGSGVEPGPTLFARVFSGGGVDFRSGQVRAAQPGAETYSG